MIKVTIVGSAVIDPVDYDADSETIAVKEDLARSFGKGMLKLNKKGVLTKYLRSGAYEYHISPLPGINDKCS